MTDIGSEALRRAARWLREDAAMDGTVKVTVEYDDGSSVVYVIPAEKAGGLPWEVVLMLNRYKESMYVLDNRGKVVID